MHNIAKSTLAIGAGIALALGGASAAHADPIVVTTVTHPVQLDECGPEQYPDPRDWVIVKDTGVSKYLFRLTNTVEVTQDGDTFDARYKFRYQPKAGYVFSAELDPDGDGQIIRYYPDFTDVPCETGGNAFGLAKR